MEKPMLFVMVGVPGSGKSTAAKKIAEKYDAIVHSSDDLRAELLGDINNQKSNSFVFNTLFSRVEHDLKEGKNAIIDSTNVERFRRENILNLFPASLCTRVAVFVATPLKKCIENNERRDRHVPEEVIKRMDMMLEEPSIEEGFQKIITV